MPETFRKASHALCRILRPVQPRRRKPKSSGMTRHGPKFKLGNRVGRWRRMREDEKERQKAAERKYKAMMKARGYELD